MKKTLLTIAIILGLGMTTFADPNGGGLFQRGLTPDEEYYGLGYYNINRDGGMPLLPNHGETGNADAPLGTGIAVLTALGAAYLVGKKRREE
jgi:hypothetical protein